MKKSGFLFYGSLTCWNIRDRSVMVAFITVYDKEEFESHGLGYVDIIMFDS